MRLKIIKSGLKIDCNYFKRLFKIMTRRGDKNLYAKLGIILKKHKLSLYFTVRRQYSQYV